MLQEVGYIRLKALLEEFKTTAAILKAPAHRLRGVRGIGAVVAQSIIGAKNNCDIDRETALIRDHGVEVLTVFDDAYPADLKEIYDPPIVLYIKGRLYSPDSIAIAIVGSRRASLYGLMTAEKLAGQLAPYGVTVVSGMARGIDTASHKGAIAGGGRTIAVLGNGLASVYPPENKKLSDEIIKNGALVSEFPMEMPPHKENFPRRNRVISGLTKGVVVVEAARRSGSLITADFALEQGRSVFSVPGAAGSITSCGTNNLIREGAKLAESAADILEEIRPSSDGKATQAINLTDPSEKSIYGLLSEEPFDIDTLIETASIEAKQTKRLLLDLEMKGLVKQLPGKLYIRA
ncbi:MAG: DNA-protecting protein DprA [Candidatus Omnitrophica bacterium]|nr:DNA-protecting protein DprA [Candidatus Omnitrophota bacterium]